MSSGLQTSSTQSLDLILEDVSAEINLSINAMDQFNRVAAEESSQALDKALFHLNKLKGVFTILEMHGALRLISESIAITNSLIKYDRPFQLRLLEVLSTGLARLMRYNEYISQKSCDLPQLLLPTINFLRHSTGATQLGESVFFRCHTHLTRKDKDLVLITSESSAAQSRHFRQMYQIGLIEVVRNTNLSGGLRMMKKAMGKLDEECVRPQSPNLWWIAQGMLDGFIEKELILTKLRFKIFSRLDRQIRLIENKPDTPLDDNKLELDLLTKEILYLTWISAAQTPTIKKILNHFSLKTPEFSDRQLRSEAEDFRGPSDQDYQSISEALADEINLIEQSLNQYIQSADNRLDLQEINKQMINLKGLLNVLKVDDQIVRLNVAIEIINKTIEEKLPLSEKDANILLIVIESLRAAVDQYELAKYSSRGSLQREKLSAAQLKICENTHTSVKQIIHQFTEFSINKRKRSLLKEISGLLEKTKTGFNQLKIQDVLSIIDGCIIFINHYLAKEPHSTSENAIKLFADIIGSLEFYLETLKHTSKPSSRIIEFAENSLWQLNRTVKKNKSS